MYLDETEEVFLKRTEEHASTINELRSSLDIIDPKDKKTIKKINSDITTIEELILQMLIFRKAHQLGFDLDKFKDIKPILPAVTIEEANRFFRSEAQKQYSCGRKGGEPNRDFSADAKVFYDSPTVPASRTTCNFADPNDPINKNRVTINGEILETGIYGLGHYYNYDTEEGKSGNPAADCAVTIVRRLNSKRAFGGIYREDNGKLAMPGGNVADGDRYAIVTGIREFLEEMHSKCSIVVKLRIIEILLKGNIKVIKNSLMLDSRVTNNASVTSFVFHFDIESCEDGEFLSSHCDPCVDETIAGSGYINIEELDKSHFWSTHTQCLEVILL